MNHCNTLPLTINWEKFFDFLADFYFITSWQPYQTPVSIMLDYNISRHAFIKSLNFKQSDLEYYFMHIFIQQTTSHRLHALD